MSGIYVHIPFCKTHCTYCAFYSELLRTPHGSESFVDALCREIRSEGFDSGKWTIYFGGGTPSVLGLEQLQRIVSAIFDSGLASASRIEEFTMEVNPDDIVRGGPEYATGLRAMGVNRISMGIQSFDDRLLHKMGRRHDSAQAMEAYRILRQAGFSNISIDLIFGFEPDLDVDQIRRNLLEMGLPQHISCYQLSIEEGSGLDRMVRRGLYEMPSDTLCEAQYYAICELLRSLGYHHYEISNWCLDGFHSRHNSNYWNHTPYLGFGPGAHSLLLEDGTKPDEGPQMIRRWNNDNLQEYLSAAQSGDWTAARGQETLTAEQRHEEEIFLGLRTAKGVSVDLLREGTSGLVSADDPARLRIPENKWFVSDSIIAGLI